MEGVGVERRREEGRVEAVESKEGGGTGRGAVKGKRHLTEEVI